MENKALDNSIIEDKALAEALFSKAALARFNEDQMQADPSFFENQQAAIAKSLNKKKVKTLAFGNWGKLAIAASILAIIATGYLYIQANKQNTTNSEYVKIEEIPSDEIENYLNSNELIAEIDWSSELIETSDIIDGTNTIIKSNYDSN